MDEDEAAEEEEDEEEGWGRLYPADANSPPTECEFS